MMTALDKQYITTIEFIKAYDKSPGFPLLYSPDYGIEWAHWTESRAEEFFVRSFPPLVEFISDKKMQDKTNLDKLILLGWKISSKEIERINKKFSEYQLNSSTHWIPSNLSIRHGSIIDQFVKTYQELFPEQLEKQQLSEKETGYKFLGVTDPSSILGLKVFEAPTPLFEFNSFDGAEAPY